MILGSLLGRVLGGRWGRVLRAFGKGFDGFWEGFVRFLSNMRLRNNIQ